MTDVTDPRFQRSRAAILTAARELLLEQGPGAVTHHQIAARAGIGRATVYRHWARSDEILAEAMATTTVPFFARPRSPYRAWLVEELTAVADQLAHEDVLAITTTLAHSALWDEAMDERRAGYAQTLSTRLATALSEASAAKELDLPVAPELAAALTLGPLYYRATIERAPSDPELIARCVEAVGQWLPLRNGEP